MQFYLGRHFAYLHNPNEGEKFLRSLTQGPARLVHNPAERAAALMFSKIELDRRNVSQSAIWMRRAVVGTLVDQGASSEEIIDVLSAYAQYLTSIRRLSDANNIFRQLAPLYDQYLPRHGPKYLTFASHYLFNLTALGYFQPSSENVLTILNDLVAAVDVPPDTVKGELFFQNLYKAARVPPADAEHPIAKQLRTIALSFPDYLKQPQPRIHGELDLADEFISAANGTDPMDDQFASYDLLLRSFIAARRNKFGESISLAQQGLERIRAFHRLAESESSARLPALGIEERLVLGLIVGMNAPHTSTFEQANSLFQLQQYLNRDKGKLVLNAAVARRGLKSSLQQEDLRSRDRMQELRDTILLYLLVSFLSKIIYRVRRTTTARS